MIPYRPVSGREALGTSLSYAIPRYFAAGEWSELGSRDIDCIGRMVIRPRERERTSHYNLYRYCHNDPVNKTDPDGLVDLSYTPSTAAFAAFQHWEATYNPSNTFKVAGHADSQGIKNASGAYVSMKRIVADIVKNNTENKPIELIACETGRGDSPFAKQLAQAVAAATGKTTQVIAPTTEVTGGKPGGPPHIHPEVKPGAKHLPLDNKARYDWSKPGHQKEFTVKP
ncbi:MAG: hypothetical protein V7609_2050 [Verrucomicrobiota bacterium]